MKHLFSLIFICIATLSVDAQNVTNSPYSRFGVGELQSLTSATYSAMGGVGIGINNPVSVNVLNPASYATAFPQRFTMQTSLLHTSTQMTTLTDEQVVNSTKFNYLIFGFPVAKWWGSSFGVLPFSEVAYNYSDYDEANDATQEFEGFGGINKLYWGNGFKIGKKISAGLNINYLFGRLNTQRRVVFNDDSFNSKSEEESTISGFQYEFGLMFNQRLKDWNLTLGITVENGNEVNSSTTTEIETFQYIGTVENTENVISSENDKQKLVLANSMGLGFSMANDKWLLAADYKITDWSDFEYLDQAYNLQESNRFSLGAEFIPEIKSISKYHKIIRYRMGFHTGATYLNLYEQSIDQTAITFGVGLPLKRSGALLNFSADLGTRGTTEFGLIKDNYAAFKIGLVLSDVWFIKRKYN